MSEQITDSDDIHSALRASIGEIEEKTPGSTGKLAEVAPKPALTGAEKPDAAADKGSSAGDSGSRAKDGKFLPKKPDETASDKPITQATDKKPDESAESAKDGAVSIDAAPATWKAEAKAEWKNLSLTIRQEIERREKDIARTVTQKAQEFSQLKGQFDEIEQVIGSRRAAWQATQGGVGAALKQLLSYSDFAGSDPAGFIAEFSQRMGVDLQALLTGNQGARQQAAPEIVQLQQTINGLTQRLQQFEGHTQQTQVSSLKSEFDAFENEKDQTTGDYAHPFYADVRDSGHLLPEMHLVKQEHPDWSPRQIMAEAYDRTVYKLSDVRTRMESMKEQRATAEREAKDRALAASNARKFTSGSPPGPNVNGSAAPKDSLRDEIAANYAALASGTGRL